MENLTKAQVIALPPGSKIGYYEFIKGKRNEPGEITAIRINPNEDNTHFFYWSEYWKEIVTDEEDECEQLIEQINENGSWIPMYGDSDTECQFCLLENTAIYQGKIIETETVTPSWSDIIGLHLNALQYGDRKGKEAAALEVRRMATIADRYNEMVKVNKLTNTEIRQWEDACKLFQKKGAIGVRSIYLLKLR